MVPTLQSLPLSKRPREKILSGTHVPALEDIVSALIGSGCATNSLSSVVAEVVELLLHRQAGVVPHFTSVKGVGQASAARLVAALALQDALHAAKHTEPLHNPQLLFEACQSICFAKQEHVLVLYLNTHLSRITREVVTIGTVSASLIHPREVFRSAIACNASAIALAHNHPSGVATPSGADREVTKRIARAGSHIGIHLVDHLICAGTTYTSLKMEAPELFC